MEELIKVSPGFGGFDFPYERADVVFLGVPLDVTSSYRSGYRFAPVRIREASANMETYLPEFDLDVFEELNIADLGDIIPTPTNLAATGERIEKTIKRVVGDGKFPIILGGEHTITYFTTKVFDDFFLIHLDAHRDLREEYLGDRLCHATVVRRILDELPSENVIQLGIRSCSKEEAEFARERKIKSYSAEAVGENLDKILNEVVETVEKRPVYLTVDIDVLDPAFAPGVATPEPGGLTTIELLRLIRGFEKLNLVGCDVVELVPPYDNGNTAFVAARVVYEVLGILAKWKKK